MMFAPVGFIPISSSHKLCFSSSAPGVCTGQPLMKLGANPQSRQGLSASVLIQQSLALMLPPHPLIPVFHRHPWVSEYKDSYSVFLRKLNWPSHSAMSALCSAVKPISHLSHGLSSHKPIPVNTAFWALVGARFTHNFITRAMSQCDIAMRN